MLGKRVKVTVDRPFGTYHPQHKELYYPINYGYIEGIIAPDGEEQDAYILGVDKPVSEFEGVVIAIVHRKNDIEEKWVVAPEGSVFSKEDIKTAIDFQEQYFDSEIIMTEVKFYKSVDEALLKFAVIAAKADGKWVFCKHRERDTYEFPGGHRESGERIINTARRELCEETGANKFDLRPLFYYSVTAPNLFNGEETFGLFCYAEITEFENELHSEIEKIIITDELPDKWTYLLIQPLLLAELRNRNIRRNPTCELLVFNDFSGVDIQEFLNIYKESSEENSKHRYPELSEKEALKKYENGYTEYMKNHFFTDSRKLFVLADVNHYLSALRLSKISPGKYYLEALETNPQFRRMGYAGDLIYRTENYLKKRNNKFIIISHVEKSNTASLNTHFAVGFEITADYYIEDGECFGSDYELTYSSEDTNKISDKRITQ